jgi:hypothetical protein
MAFLARIGSTIAGSPCSSLFQRQVSHHRIEIDRMVAGNKGIVTVKVDMLPTDRRAVFEKGQCFGVFDRLILVDHQARIAPACKSPKTSLTEFSAVWAYNPYVLAYSIMSRCARSVGPAVSKP